MSAGRPTKYEPRMVEMAREYIKSCGREATELPTIEGLALKLDVDDDQINEWGKKYPEFHATTVKLKRTQKNQLVNDGLYGGKEVNSSMAIFLLKANHEMMETEKKVLVGEEGKEINIRIIEDKIKSDE